MDVCFTGPAIGVLTGIALTIGGAMSAMFWQIISSKNAHIRYLETVNADLTEIVNPALTVARASVEEVRTTRRRQLPPAGRQGQ